MNTKAKHLTVFFYCVNNFKKAMKLPRNHCLNINLKYICILNKVCLYGSKWIIDPAHSEIQLAST